MKKCSYCDEEIQSEEKNCPFCAEPLLPERNISSKEDNSHLEVKKEEQQDECKTSLNEKIKLEAFGLTEKLHDFIHGQWKQECLKKNLKPTFVMAVMLQDSRGEYVNGGLFANGTKELTALQLAALKKVLEDEKGDFICW